jgi:hypothetical protein
MVLVTHNQKPEVRKPGEESFDFPSALITTKLSDIEGALCSALSAEWGNQINAAFTQKPFIQCFAVVGPIANHSISRIWGKADVDGRLNEFYFMGRGALNVSGHRKTCSVCEGHNHIDVAALCLADSKAPFFPAQRCRR